MQCVICVKNLCIMKIIFFSGYCSFIKLFFLSHIQSPDTTALPRKLESR